MKQLLKFVVVYVGLSGIASATPLVYNNYGVLLAPVNISAVHFNNFGTIDFSILTAFTNRSGAAFIALSGNMYDTYGTLYFTNANSGVMTGEPGFRFADVTPTTVRPATSFVNRGVITALDTPAEINIYNVGATGGGIIIPNQNQLLPSQLVIQAVNVANSGTLAVGNGGTMNVTGKNVDLSYGIMTAGDLTSTNAVSLDESLAAEQYVLAGGKLYTQDATGMFDILWGETNGAMNRVDNIVTPELDGLYTVILPAPQGTTNRAGFIDQLPIFGTGMSAFAFEYAVPPGQTTNIYYNVVFVNTNFADPATSVTVGFGAAIAGFAWAPILPNQGDIHGLPDLVTFTENVVDPISGQAVANSIFLEDDGAALAPFALAQNAAYAAPYSRPDIFEVTTTQPFIVNDFVPSNVTFDPGEIYIPGEMAAVVTMTNAVYETQIGRNPENLAGVFEEVSGGLTTLSDIPDVTNSPGRITINADNLNFHNLKLRAEGLLTINATNVTGLPTVFNYGTADINLGSVTNSLIISNLIPVLFDQLRGNLEAWSGDWINMQTNATSTNTIHTHVLFVGDNLSAKYTPTIRNFSVKSTNIVLSDALQVIGSAVFNTRNLTVNGALHLTQGASDLTPLGTPNLRNVFVSSNGSFIVDSLLDLGFNITRPVTATSPVGRAYSVLSITNQGTIIATAPTFQARTIENDGTIASVNSGSIVLAANFLGLGLSGASTNSIDAGGTVTLSANFIEATNSTITANQLVLTAVRELTDFTPMPATLGVKTPSINTWTATNQLDLTRKPLAGSLFGTEIHVLAEPGAPSTTTWAGTDDGPTLGGYANNIVIGHLLLDRATTNSIMQFFAVGRKSAMYVNYLELTNSSYGDYADTNNFYIDPHLTVYFAGANVPVDKLAAIYPQLVFVGSNVLTEVAMLSAQRAKESAAKPRASRTVGPVAPTLSVTPGVYSGLFEPLSGVAVDNSGYFTFTLSGNGAFSGRLLLGSTAIPFSSRLGASGSASITIRGLSIQILVDSGGNVVGEVGNGAWQSILSGAVTPAWNAKNAAPDAGRFALVLPGAGGDAPAENSFGTVSVNALGIITATGRLADGAAFSQSTRLSKDGQWPFFTYAPAGKDVLVGWMNFTGDHSGLSGTVTWMKPAQPNYPTGFGVSVPAVGTLNAVPGGSGAKGQ